MILQYHTPFPSYLPAPLSLLLPFPWQSTRLWVIPSPCYELRIAQPLTLGSIRCEMFHNRCCWKRCMPSTMHILCEENDDEPADLWKCCSNFQTTPSYHNDHINTQFMCQYPLGFGGNIGLVATWGLLQIPQFCCCFCTAFSLEQLQYWTVCVLVPLQNCEPATSKLRTPPLWNRGANLQSFTNGWWRGTSIATIN